MMELVLEQSLHARTADARNLRTLLEGALIWSPECLCPTVEQMTCLSYVFTTYRENPNGDWGKNTIRKLRMTEQQYMAAAIQTYALLTNAPRIVWLEDVHHPEIIDTSITSSIEEHLTKHGPMEVKEQRKLSFAHLLRGDDENMKLAVCAAAQAQAKIDYAREDLLLGLLGYHAQNSGSGTWVISLGAMHKLFPGKLSAFAATHGHSYRLVTDYPHYHGVWYALCDQFQHDARQVSLEIARITTLEGVHLGLLNLNGIKNTHTYEWAFTRELLTRGREYLALLCANFSRTAGRIITDRDGGMGLVRDTFKQAGLLFTQGQAARIYRKEYSGQTLPELIAPV